LLGLGRGQKSQGEQHHRNCAGTITHIPYCTRNTAIF
jgi:hypothetical protein